MRRHPRADLGPSGFTRWRCCGSIESLRSDGKVSAQGNTPAETGMRIPSLATLAAVLGGGLFGLGMSLLPSPEEIGVFWVGNFAGPWLAAAFLAGWKQRSHLRAAMAGAACDL